MDLDDNELKAKRESNGADRRGAEDIKRLKEKINNIKKYDTYRYDWTEADIQTIEHLIKAYKELEEENKELNFYKEWYEFYKKEISERNIKARQVLAKLKGIKETDIVNLYEINILDEIEKELKNFIPVSLVEEKIEELKNEDLEIYDTDSEDLIIAKYEQRAILDFLQELLEKR